MFSEFPSLCYCRILPATAVPPLLPTTPPCMRAHRAQVRPEGAAAAADGAVGPSDSAAAAAAECAPAAVSLAPSAEQMLAIKAAVANAQTIEEIRRLEEALKTGHLPSEYQMDKQATVANGAAGAAVAEAGSKPDGMEVG